LSTHSCRHRYFRIRHPRPRRYCYCRKLPRLQNRWRCQRLEGRAFRAGPEPPKFVPPVVKNQFLVCRLRQYGSHAVACLGRQSVGPRHRPRDVHRHQHDRSVDGAEPVGRVFPDDHWLCAAFRIASASATSCGRPDASFDTMRSSAEMKFAFKPVAGSITLSTRLSHAASKSTPGISGRMSKPFGSRPKRKKLRRSANSSGRIPWSAAPNSASAA